jgi:hypothetical protein
MARRKVSRPVNISLFTARAGSIVLARRCSGVDGFQQTSADVLCLGGVPRTNDSQATVAPFGRASFDLYESDGPASIFTRRRFLPEVFSPDG